MSVKNKAFLYEISYKLTVFINLKVVWQIEKTHCMMRYIEFKWSEI
jgi:hypothetical protein